MKIEIVIKVEGFTPPMVYRYEFPPCPGVYTPEKCDKDFFNCKNNCDRRDN